MMNYNSSFLRNKTLFHPLKTGEQQCCASIDDTQPAVFNRHSSRYYKSTGYAVRW
ncbi:hypothetical protein [Chromatium okenii]|uniref:hypothetical protein n=1 Tax=Chromatium okenii TaxID=61644 RepID=UPI001A91D44E|nr:hypothetical protein [Chromatium okenii]